MVNKNDNYNNDQPIVTERKLYNIDEKTSTEPLEETIKTSMEHLAVQGKNDRVPFDMKQTSKLNKYKRTSTRPAPGTVQAMMKKFNQ